MKNVLIIFSLLLLTACGGKKDAAPVVDETPVHSDTEVKLTAAQMKNAAVQLGSPEMKSISSLLRVNGRIDVPPQNIVSISVPLGGYLRSSSLLPGMQVRKGQTIALMEDPQYIQLQQDYLTSRAKLQYAELEYNRQKELNESKAGSDKVYQQALAELSMQQIMVRSLAEKLRLIHINPEKLTVASISRYSAVPSPINGFVSKVNVNIGKYVTPAESLFEIINPADIHLALDIFEKDVNKLFIGQSLFAYTNANPNKKYSCKILLISKDISDDKSYQVHCHFDQYDKDLLPGMFMNADIEIKNRESFVLPSDAIVSFEQKQFVFIEKAANTFELMEVVTGDSENGYTAIDPVSQGKLKDKKIAVKGAYNLLMAMKNTSDE